MSRSIRCWSLVLIASLFASLPSSLASAEPPAASPPATGPAAKSPTAAKSPAATVAPPPSPAALREATTLLLKQWAAAQHGGDATTYLSLYDRAHFKGEKRTTSGERKRYDYAAWAADRGAMIKKQPEVAVDQLVIETWRDPTSHLKPNVVEARFLQRWRTPRYADHGPKLVQLVWSTDGKLRIIFEALLESRPGWDQPLGTVVPMEVPRDDAGALALWGKIAPTGKDWESRLATIPDVPQLRRALARALLGSGDLQCTAIDAWGECGTTRAEWTPLKDGATLDDPCLRRRVAVWVLGTGALSAADLRTLWPRLLPAFGWKTPEKEADDDPGSKSGDALCSAILGAASVDPELHTAAVTAAIDEKCADSEARGNVSRLPEKARVALAEHGVEEAFKELAPKKYPALFLAAIAGKGATEHRIALMERLATELPTDAVRAALRAVASDGSDVKVSAMAGVALAKLGDPSCLPQRPKEENDSELRLQLERLFHDPDSARRDQRLRAFLPKKGRFTIHEWVEFEYDGNTPPEERSEDTDEKRHISVDEVDWETLRPYFEPEDGRTVTLDWTTVGGKTYLSGIEITVHRFIGCPC